VSRISRAVVYCGAVFAILPSAIVLFASFTAGDALDFPPHGLSLRWYEALAQNPDFVGAAKNSLILATVTAAVAVTLGTLATLGIVRYSFPGSRALALFFLAPLGVPHVVLGLGILELYNQLDLQASLGTLLLGHLLIAVPFTLRLTMVSLAGLDRKIEFAAASLGAAPASVMRRVILPQMRLALVGATIIAFVFSFDDVSMTVFLVQPGFTTLPVELFAYAENVTTPIVESASVVLLLVSIVAMLILDRLIGIDRILRVGH
jgi:putative spermidine/putrescine transport system permease protein